MGPHRPVISGKKESIFDHSSQDVRPLQICRSLDLPVEVEPNKTAATFSEGELEVTLPKVAFDSAQQYDKLVSIGMCEHVGEALLPEYFARAWQLLRAGDVFLDHGIAIPTGHPGNGLSFFDRYVFPDGELVPISTSLGAAESSGFEVRDVERLREHSALTLHLWVCRLEAHAEEARRITDETTYRIWRLYMAASAHRFRLNQLNIYQVLLAKPLRGESGMPLTRADWYRD